MLSDNLKIQLFFIFLYNYIITTTNSWTGHMVRYQVLVKRICDLFIMRMMSIKLQDR